MVKGVSTAKGGREHATQHLDSGVGNNLSMGGSKGKKYGYLHSVA